MTKKNFKNLEDINNNRELNDICDECKKIDESVTQNLILTGFKICKSCRISIKIFTISGKLVKTINGNIENSASASLSRDFFWDGKDDFGEKLAKGVYIYNLTIKSEFTQNKASKTEKLVIL